MQWAYEKAHHSFIDDSEIIVDYNRQQLMPGWIPRRLGGGLGDKKESGQLRFGGRERSFSAPLRPIPSDDLKWLGIPPPPEGNYMSRFEIPSLPQRKNLQTGKIEAADITQDQAAGIAYMKKGSPCHKHSRSYHDERERSYSHECHYVEREDNSERSRDSHRLKRASRSRDHRSHAR